MSDEDEEGGRLVVRKLAWRSERLQNLLLKLDRKVQSKRDGGPARGRLERTPGPDSERIAPRSPPVWAVQDQQSEDEEMQSAGEDEQ